MTPERRSRGAPPPPNSAAASRAVVVAGDVTIDWNIAHTRAAGSDGTTWNARDAARARGQRGGAALLADLVARVAPPGVTVHGPEVAADGIGPDDARFHHSYALWSAPDGAWRVAQFLGVDARAVPAEPAGDARPAREDPQAADLVVLDDAALGFRERSAAWPRVLGDRRRRPWVVLKMARPVADGALWRRLLDERADRLVVVMTVDDLRRSEVRISRDLSWERTAQDLAWELVHNPRVNALARVAHVIASFGPAGAFVLTRSDAASPPRARLLFDPDGSEGSWALDHPGGMIGHTTCLAAALARRLLLEPGAPDLEAAVQAGVAAMRGLHATGYDAIAGSLAFPLDTVAATLAGAERPLAAADVQDPVRFVAGGGGSRPARPATWSIAEDRFADGVEAVARRAALEGVESALPGVPRGRFGSLVSVDRHEIESLRAIRALVAEYARGRETRPVSIAVFGAPGSGKSFGITQVARSLLPGRIQTMTFNLSQLRDPRELHDAFHLVRDAALSGRFPLVFWDEFDSAPAGDTLGWLRHFLAPMQDGEFQQGQVIHPIGRCIFVFAGGLYESMDAFGRDVPAAEFRALKGPDFVSRLRGFVDVLGPNPRSAGRDPFVPLRRAVLLRALLQKHHAQLFHEGRLSIDAGLLRAFLGTRRYRHGARSMEAVVTTSALAGRRSYDRSSLPAESQLDLHVEARDFLALVQRLDLDGDLLERLAQAAHEVYAEGLRARGERTPSAERTYESLPEEQKDQNRGLVRDIPTKLSAAGYVMAPARSDEPPFDFPGAELERLAEMEHDRWLRAKIAAGWRWGERTDPERRLHAALLPWAARAAGPRNDGEGALTVEELRALGPDPLPDSEKEKDRDLVRGIPRILARAGYTVLRVGDPAPL